MDELRRQIRSVRCGLAITPRFFRATLHLALILMICGQTAAPATVSPACVPSVVNVNRELFNETDPFDRVLKGSPQFKIADEMVKREFLPRKNEFEAESKKLQADVDRYKAEQAGLTDDARKALQASLTAQHSALESEKTLLQNEFIERNRVLLVQLRDIENRSIVQVSLQEGCSASNNGTSLAQISGDTLDISKEVAKNLDGLPKPVFASPSAAEGGEAKDPLPHVFPKTCKRPEYPAQSIAAKQTGTVEIALLVSTEGRVKKTEVRSSSGFPLLDESAVSALSTCTFVPAVNNGAAVEIWTSLKYTFKYNP